MAPLQSRKRAVDMRGKRDKNCGRGEMFIEFFCTLRKSIWASGVFFECMLMQCRGGEKVHTNMKFARRTLKNYKCLSGNSCMAATREIKCFFLLRSN